MRIAAKRRINKLFSVLWKGEEFKPFHPVCDHTLNQVIEHAQDSDIFQAKTQKAIT